jgi:hypothetical protein
LKRQLVLGIHRGEVVNERRNAAVDSIVTAQEIAESRVWDISDRIVGALESIGISYDGQTGVFLTGGGLGYLRGAKDIISAELGQTVKYYAHQSPFLGGPTYTAVAGTLYYALNVLQGAAASGIAGWIKNLF